MNGMWDRTLVYLGLREEPDEAYDDLPERFVPEHDPAMDRQRTAVATATAPRVVDLERDPAPRAAMSGDASNVRPLRTSDVTVRPASAGLGGARAALVRIERFDDVEAVGARYRTGQPVLFDVAAADAATARRVVDFVSGLTYALRGHLRKVGTRAFLLLPDGVSLSDDEQERLRSLGYRLPTGSEG